jgi:hypothetical protein
MNNKYREEEYEGLYAPYEEPSESMFDSLHSYEFEYCPKCHYDGPLDAKRKGYTCPKCRTIVLPMD